MEMPPLQLYDYSIWIQNKLSDKATEYASVSVNIFKPSWILKPEIPCLLVQTVRVQVSTLKLHNNNTWTWLAALIPVSVRSFCLSLVPQDSSIEDLVFKWEGEGEGEREVIAAN